jgi:superfamily II DNA or RNA helicase
MDAYRRKGIRAEHVDGTTPKAERKAALERLRRHQIDVLFNCALFVEGLDLIEVECIQLLTSTESLAKFLQAVGRGLRPARGKRELILIDHGGNSARHDCVDADRDWYGGGQSLDRAKKTCLCCGTIIGAQANLCPACFKDPALTAKPSQMKQAREERAQSKATPPRPCPEWAVRVRDEWVRMEQARFAQGLPLSETERYCRRLLKTAA